MPRSYAVETTTDTVSVVALNDFSRLRGIGDGLVSPETPNATPSCTLFLHPSTPQLLSRRLISLSSSYDSWARSRRAGNLSLLQLSPGPRPP